MAEIILREIHQFILRNLQEYTRLTAKQLFLLITNYKQSSIQAALKYLHNTKYIARAAYHQLYTKATKASYVYKLTSKGVKVIAQNFDERISTASSPKYAGFQLPHLIAINEVRILFEKACVTHPTIEMVKVIPEYRGMVEAKDVPHRTVQGFIKSSSGKLLTWTKIPDLVVILAKEKKRLLMLVEIDRGTESKAVLIDKATAYDQYYTTRGFEQYSQEFDYAFSGFRLLFIGKQKMFGRVFDALADMSIDSTFMWAADEADLNEHTLFTAPVWIKGGQSPSHRYSLLEA